MNNTKHPGRTAETTPLIPDDLALEWVRWSAALLLAIIAFLAAVKLIEILYHPDISSAILFAQETLIDATGARPYPMKRLLYSLAVVAFPVLLFGFYFLMRQSLAGLRRNTIKILYISSLLLGVLAVLFLLYKGLAAPNPFANAPENGHDLVAKTNADFYFMGSFIYSHFPWFLLVLFPLILSYLLYKERIPAKWSPPFNIVEKILTYGFCGLLALSVFFMNSFSFPRTWENAYDFNSVFYSVVQVYNGVPLLIDHFTNTYGLYPHFVVPLLKLFGLSVLSFSTTMAVLALLCFFFQLLFLRSVVTNRILVLLGITSIFFMCYMLNRTATNFDAYFAMVPLRWILPSSLLLYSAIYLKYRSRVLYYASFCVFACGILWTPDFGLLSFLSLIAFYIYLEFENPRFSTIAVNTAAHLAIGAGSVIATFLTYSYCIRFAYGAFPDMSLLFSTIKVFSVVGAGMLAMPKTIHPWMLVALTYLVGLCYSIRHILTRTISPRAAGVFLLTVVGVLSFQYYWGRSHNSNLTAVMPPFFGLLTVFADDLLGLTRRNRILVVPFALLIFILSFSVFQTLYAHRKIVDVISANHDKRENAIEQNWLNANVRFIRSHAREKEKILILSADYRQGLYYEMSKTAAAVNPGIEELFLKSDYQRLRQYLLLNDSTKVFVELPDFPFRRGAIPSILSSLYRVSSVEKTERGIMFLTRRKENAGALRVFKNDPNAVLHELFDRNLLAKLQHAVGEAGGISLEDTFSVEVVFKPADIASCSLTTGATVFSNYRDGAGMILLQHGSNRTEYMFSFGGYGIPIPVELGKWNYLAIEVAPDYVRIYRDGAILSSVRIGSPGIVYRNTSEPLYLGNADMRNGFFFGDIRELRIKNGKLERNEVAEGWAGVKTLHDGP